MTVRELISKLSTLDPNLPVATSNGEYDAEATDIGIQHFDVICGALEFNPSGNPYVVLKDF